MTGAHATHDPARLAEQVASRIGLRPHVFVVLGSGLGAVEQSIESPVIVPFEELKGMPRPTVPGHAGRFDRVLVLCRRPGRVARG